MRVLTRPLIAQLSGAHSTAGKAAVILTQNPETAHRIGRLSKTRVLPNGLVGGVFVEDERPAKDRTIVAAGRLIGWKGMALAISAMRHLSSEEQLDIFGEGPDRRRLERLTRRWGLQDRVHFRGRVPRDEVLAAMAGARVFLHPALHEDSGMTVAEALSLGTPVVCLDRGGPPVLVQHWPEVPSRVVPPSGPAATARRLADALREVSGHRTEPDLSPVERFAHDLLATYANVGERAR
jgi:glycosyltransferase involved in cell wall biosynthesis